MVGVEVGMLAQVGVGVEVVEVVMQSKSGAHPVGLANRIALLPMLKLSVTLLVPIVNQLPLLGNSTIIGDPLLTLIVAYRLVVSPFI